MPDYDITVTRDGRWWMIAIPALDGLTQAEHFDEIDGMARSYIAVATDTLIDEVSVRIVGDVDALLEVIEDLKDRLSVHERDGKIIPLDQLRTELNLDD
jgi:hypothetical protein